MSCFGWLYPGAGVRAASEEQVGAVRRQLGVPLLRIDDAVLVYYSISKLTIMINKSHNNCDYVFQIVKV